MSKREVGSLACKLLGIYMIMQGLNVLANVVAVHATTPGQFAAQNPMTLVFPFLFLIVFGILLWLLSDKLSGIMVKGESPLSGDSGIKAG